MTDDGNPQSTPPESATPPGASPTPPGAAPDTATEPAKKPASVSQAMLIWVGIAVVVLSFFAAFLGSWLARSADSNEAAATPPPTTAEIDEAAFEDALEEILPAGSAVRAGTGVPESGKGYEGDVYIDISTADVYLFQDGDWTFVGNIRTSAAENLTGATGPAGEAGATGEQGATGETGETGAPGAPGTQLTLGPRSARQRDLHRGRRRLHRHRDRPVLRVHRRGVGALRPDRQRRSHGDARAHRGARGLIRSTPAPRRRSAGCRFASPGRSSGLHRSPSGPEWREGPSVCHNYLLNGRSGIPAGTPAPSASTLGPDGVPSETVRSGENHG